MVNEIKNNYRKASLVEALQAFHDKKLSEQTKSDLDDHSSHDFRKQHNIPRKHF